KHVQPGRDNHQVRRPTMHVAQKLPERYVVLEIEDVAKCLDLRRVVIEHQQYAREGAHDEEIERDSTHSPRVLIAQCVPVDLRRMQMKKDIRENRERTVAGVGTLVRNAEDRLPDLCLLWILVVFGFFKRTILQRDR